MGLLPVIVCLFVAKFDVEISFPLNILRTNGHTLAKLCYYKCSVTLPQPAMGWSAVCDRGIS